MDRRKLSRGVVAAVAAVSLSLFPAVELGLHANAQEDPTGTSSSSSRIDFARDILPILENFCYSCHGTGLQMGQLRLDSKEQALAGGQSGSVIHPGKAMESPLYERVAGMGDLERMPLGGALENREIELIRTWIDQGAIWLEALEEGTSQRPKHWAFVAPVGPSLPKIDQKDWPTNAIDQFILSHLEKEGLSPSPEVDRVTLLRRLSLDLVGLPSTIQEVDAFLGDQSRGAYQRQVDRLLSSPHYGERWGRHWLDAARYADSDGFEKDMPRTVWFYRDWVINALNRDLPYDQFIIEQIAGDLLPNATQDQIVATGFLRNSMINAEGGIDPEQFRMEAMFDRMDAIGKGILGLTIQCSQCHNHKYDPLTQEEYYRMFAFLNNSHESNIAVYTPEERIERERISRQVLEIETDLQHRYPDWEQRMDRWEQTVREDQPNWVVVQPTVDEISAGGQKYLTLQDGSFLVQGFAATKHRIKMTMKTDVHNITAFRLELLNDPNLPLGGPGRSFKGTAALTEFEVEEASAHQPEDVRQVKIVTATADISLPETPLEAVFDDKSGRGRVTGPIEFAIDGDETTAWGIDAGPVRRNQPRKAVFVPETPISNPNGTLLTFYLSQKHGGWSADNNLTNNLGHFRLSMTSEPEVSVDLLPKQVRVLLTLPRDQRTPLQVRKVFSYWRTTVSEWQEANSRIEKLWRQHPEGSSQLVLNEQGEPRETNLLVRGDFLKPGRAVAPGVPGFLNPFPSGVPQNRLGFARWLVDRKSPTTARALVNRVWQTYFGTGLVATSEDLGTQSEPVSHPQLLDWLAVEFMHRDWSLKAMHRLIVTSSTYRQSSRVTPELYEHDPYNLLLARGPRFRVEAEIVRDIALAASGLLNPRIGGPSVHSPAPSFLFVPPASYGPKIWNEATGSDRYRRALYTFRFRSVPYPALQTFDAPNGDFSCVRRVRSNTPLQALTTLNEQLFLETARALALKTLREGGEKDPERVVYAFRRCLARTPTEQEMAELLDLLKRQTDRFAQGWVSAWDIAGFDLSQGPKLPEDTTPVQLAAWTTVSRVLLNLDETITKE